MQFRAIALAAAIAFTAGAALAQGYPGGGTHRTERSGGSPGAGTSIIRNAPATRGADTPPHRMLALADALTRERQNMQLSPDAAKAMDQLVRDLKDYAALDDRHVGVRVGWTKHTAYAAVDLQRDLVAQEDEVHAIAAAAADLVKDWKALDPLLSAEQRTRILSIYGSFTAPKAAQ